MKYFSLSYMLSEKDYNDYEKIVFKGTLIISLKKMVVPFCLIIGMCLFMDVLFALPAVIYFAISIIIPQAINREFSKKREKTQSFLKDLWSLIFIMTILL